MALNVYLVEPVSIVAFCIMVASLIIAYYKKWMMTYALIVSNIVIFIITFATQTNFNNIGSSHIIQNLAFRPAYLSVENSPQLYTLFSSMFVHGGALHIFGNMIVLFFVGMAFEDRIGPKKFIIIYILSGFCGTVAHSFMNLGSYTALIGASGAIFGIMGAFAVSYPRDEVVMPIPLGFFMILRRIKVIYAVLIFAVLETVIVFFGVQDNTAHFAHIGGLIGGFVLAAVLLRGRRTHTKEGKTIYYDSPIPQRPDSIDFSKLEELADTPELKEMLKKIKNESVPQVRDIWIEHFFEKAHCPKCSSKLNHFNRNVSCKNCGFKSKY
jgi:membrane associated rhomboid family serine protease